MDVARRDLRRRMRCRKRSVAETRRWATTTAAQAMVNALKQTYGRLPLSDLWFATPVFSQLFPFKDVQSYGPADDE